MSARKELDQISESWRYPGGEIGVRATGDCAGELLARIQSSDDLVRLLMYLDAVHQAGGDTPDCVFIPYLPYARQDRVAAPGDPLAIGVLARALAGAGIGMVATLDAHSLVAGRVFDEAGISFESLWPERYLSEYLLRVGLNRDRLWFVAPDAGAAAKVRSYAEELRVRDVIECRKVRDPATGKLSGFQVATGPRELPDGSALVVVDDICDGGGTFIGVAQALAAHFDWHHPLHLFTSHGIYSKGLFPLTYAGYRTIGSTDSFRHEHSGEQLITIPL